MNYYGINVPAKLGYRAQVHIFKRQWTTSTFVLKIKMGGGVGGGMGGQREDQQRPI